MRLKIKHFTVTGFVAITFIIGITYVYMYMYGIGYLHVYIQFVDTSVRLLSTGSHKNSKTHSGAISILNDQLSRDDDVFGNAIVCCRADVSRTLLFINML